MRPYIGATGAPELPDHRHEEDEMLDARFAMLAAADTIVQCTGKL